MMHGWWNYGDGVPWFGMLLGPVTMIAFVVLLVVLIAYIVRPSGARPPSIAPAQSPLDILKERFARGEIDQTEYENRKQALSR